MMRLAKIDKSLGKSDRRSMIVYHNEMKRVIAMHELPLHVQQTAWSIIMVVANRRLARGHTMRSITAAAIYRSSLFHGMAMFRNEFMEDGITPKELQGAFKVVDPVIKEKYTIRRVAISKYIYRMGGRANVQHQGTMHAMMLASKVAEKDQSIFIGKSPATIVAGLLYIACKTTRSSIGGKFPTQTIVAHECSVTEVSVRNMAKKIMKTLGISLKD
jgi:transcription initiation factor TFIIIB Brf1 subunit/transcription initiation factor TFIIB